MPAYRRRVEISQKGEVTKPAACLGFTQRGEKTKKVIDLSEFPYHLQGKGGEQNCVHTHERIRKTAKKQRKRHRPGARANKYMCKISPAHAEDTAKGDKCAYRMCMNLLVCRCTRLCGRIYFSCATVIV
ncbi:hypothetical protein POVWA2_054820 [Plasmodium ovale wallikeri]|uniref:Uncharacterized protein n=1 Tax=Plasmodium ovale wallikeri TaxID=864142 RepID=A0A1A8ZTV1_PLAOA|nr:hypothetical protein POVWA1_055910 [Plasmodium ovale wallikeri]SBT47785.1 hypothetical protein POVWA2_054820 [Plasmodium ovale wallikeri]